jgi:4-hydroxybenzoate polyprenyltransferase
VNLSHLKRSPFVRYGLGGGLALAVAYFAASVLPEYCAPLAWLICAAAFGIIGRQAWRDWQDEIDRRAEDAKLEAGDGD